MLIEQLKADYRLIYRFIEEERRMREVVFLPGNPKRKQKLQEANDALLALLRIKELLKAHLTVNPEAELQQPLLELPAERKEYR